MHLDFDNIFSLHITSLFKMKFNIQNQKYLGVVSAELGTTGLTSRARFPPHQLFHLRRIFVCLFVTHLQNEVIVYTWKGCYEH